MKHESRIVLLGMVTEVLRFSEDNPLNIYTIKVKCISQSSDTTTFFVDTQNPILRTKLKSYKANDIVLLEGNYLFGRIVLSQINRITSYKSTKDALSFLLGMEFSNLVYVQGTRKGNELTVVLNEDTPMNGFIDTSYTFLLQDNKDEKFKKKREIILVGTFIGSNFETKSVSSIID